MASLSSLMRNAQRKLRHAATPKKQIIDRFHRLYYDAGDQLGLTWKDTSWLGVPVRKCPLDLWLYQEILFELRPDLIIETGTFVGGSAYYLASLCDALGKGKVITVDIKQFGSPPAHDRIQYLLGSSVADDIVQQIRERTRGMDTVLVILDSDHTKPHVLQELRIYSAFVTKGSYMIVEDTNINGHPVVPTFGPGPMEAMEDFLRGNRDFASDPKKDKYYLTFNPQGYLRKLR